jgi:Bacterial Ig-like domain (group 3)/FG-GAP-like repeat
MLKRALSGLVLLALTSLPAAAQAKQFLQAPWYSTGANSNPQAFAVADFNNDGIPDVAVADSNLNTVSIFLGKGDGTFIPVNCSSGSAACPTGISPVGVTAADFNHDGNMDLAVANNGSNTITILFGNGNGSFAAQPSLATGGNPRSIVAAAFNGDNNYDIVVANSAQTSHNIGLFLNNGRGGFGAQTTYDTGLNPWSIAVGDFNNDGILDVVVANNNNENFISVFLGQTGTNGAFNGFGTQSAYFLQGEGLPVSVAVGDFNGDGNLDLAVADQSVQGTGTGSDNVGIMEGSGTGVFTWTSSYNTALQPVSLIAADLNGDGNLDLAVVAQDANIVTVFWGNGNGIFGGQVNCGTGDFPSAVVAADLTNNGTKDLIVSNLFGNSFSVILNNRNSTFQSRLDYAAGQNPQSVIMADFNGDGIPDLAVANSAASGISVTLGNGDGTFQPPTFYSTGNATDPVFIVEGDFNQDGIPDFAVANNATSTVSGFFGVGNGTFGTPNNYNVGNPNLNPVAFPTAIAVGDFNGDGYPDLAVTNSAENNVTILLNGGKSNPGAFAPAPNCTSSQNGCPVGTGPIAIAAGYFDGNQTLDLVVINESDNPPDATVLLGNGNGTFTAESPTLPLPAGSDPVSVAVADLNGDGIPDLAVADKGSQRVSVLLGNGSNGVGNGTFQAAVNYLTGPNLSASPSPVGVVIGDFNGDGIPDLALASSSSGANPGNEVSLLWGIANSQGKPSGTFSEPALFGAGYLPSSLVVGDFNMDGARDLAVANAGGNTVSVLLNLQGTAIVIKPSLAPSTYGQSVTLTATVAASVSNGAAPTGSVTFENGNTIIGTAQTLSSSGEASVSTSGLPAGTNSLAAIYSGDSNYQPHTVSLSQKVSAATSVTSLTSTPNPSAPNQTATFTASVSSPTTQPGGVVTFFDGSTTIGTGTLNGGGQASFSTSTLATGTHNITAAYAGNSNIAGSTSSALQQVIGVVTAPNFSLTATWSTSNNVAPGSTATALVTIIPVGGLNPANVQLSCTVSPSASPAASCQLGSITVANGQGTAQLTFKTAGPTSALMIPSDNHGSNMLFAVGLMIPALMLGGAGLTKPGRKKFMSFCLFLALAGCVANMACGGGGSGSTTPPPSGNSGTPAGNYQIIVSGTASGITNPPPATLSATVN